MGNIFSRHNTHDSTNLDPDTATLQTVFGYDRPTINSCTFPSPRGTRIIATVTLGVEFDLVDAWGEDIAYTAENHHTTSHERMVAGIVWHRAREVLNHVIDGSRGE